MPKQRVVEQHISNSFALMYSAFTVFHHLSNGWNRVKLKLGHCRLCKWKICPDVLFFKDAFRPQRWLTLIMNLWIVIHNKLMMNNFVGNNLILLCIVFLGGIISSWNKAIWFIGDPQHFRISELVPCGCTLIVAMLTWDQMPPNSFWAANLPCPPPPQLHICHLHVLLSFFLWLSERLKYAVYFILFYRLKYKL